MDVEVKGKVVVGGGPGSWRGVVGSSRNGDPVHVATGKRASAKVVVGMEEDGKWGNGVRAMEGHTVVVLSLIHI